MRRLADGQQLRTLLQRRIVENEVKILITFALDTEFAPWRGLRPFVKSSNEKLTLYKSNLEGAEVRVLLTGVGYANAAKAVRVAIEWRPDVCISSGLAGSLRDDLQIAQVCAAREVVELETARSVKADENLLVAAEDCRARVIEKLLTSAEMVLSAEGKTRLEQMAEAVEMESFAVMSEAAAARIPAVTIRAISDAADEDLPMDFGKVLDENGKVNTAKVVREIARAPQRVPALIRLSKNSRAAARELANFLERYVAQLAATHEPLTEMVGTRQA